MGKKGRRKAQQSPSGAHEHVIDKEVLTICQKIFELISLETPVLPAKQWEEHLKLREMVEKIRERQADLTLFEKSDHSRKDHISSFVQWFNENGGKAEHVVIDDFGQQGLGLKAVSDIKSGELFITIPRKLMLSAETARNSELGPLIEKDNILRVMQNACLVLHVYCEKLKENSFWKPYLDILPTSYSTTLYFTVDEMQALKGSPAFGEALKLYRNIARQYAYLYQRLQHVCPEKDKIPMSGKNFTFDDHRWAVSTVITRQNKIPSTTGEPTLALIPMWDMCNHCNGTITTGYDMAEDSCKSLSVKDFKAGEQVCIFYGERSNADLLVHNGFVFEDNIHDKVAIQLGVSRSDPLFQMKEKLLALMGMTASSHWYSVPCGDDPIGPELVTFLRVFSMDEDELKEWLEKASENINELKKLSAVLFFVKEETESKCWQFIETRLSLLLGQYKTSDAEECELLESSEISHHKKLCIKLKRAERKVLQNALKYASTARKGNAEPRLESDGSPGIENDKRNSNDHVENERLTNTNTSDEMDQTASAASQLCIDGE
ncbi:hypothetical protein ACROYT_G007166 [Oculina patagonica]